MNFYQISDNSVILVENIENFELINGLNTDFSLIKRKSFKEMHLKQMILKDQMTKLLHELIEVLIIILLFFILKESAKGNLQTIQKILDSKFDINEDNNFSSISLLLERKKVLFNEIGNKGWNAIHAAILKEQIDVIAFYISK